MSNKNYQRIIYQLNMLIILDRVQMMNKYRGKDNIFHVIRHK